MTEVVTISILGISFLIALFIVTTKRDTILSLFDKEEEQEVVFISDEARDSSIRSLVRNDAELAGAEEKVIEELLLMPEWLWKRYLQKEGAIIITSVMPENNKGFVATFEGELDKKGVKRGTAKITINANKGIEYNLVHEMMHFFCYEFDVDLKRVFLSCSQEMDRFVKEYCSNNNYYKVEKELFAEVGNLYFHKVLKPEEYPLMYGFFKNLIESFE